MGWICAIKKPTLLIIMIISALAVFAEEANGRRFIERFELLPLFEFEQDIRTFSWHKNEAFRETYFLAAKSDFHARIVTYEEFAHFGIKYSTEMGAGFQKDRAMTFDPLETNYAIVPYFMADINAVFYEIGLDHRCFHHIDRKGSAVPYWNQVYAKASATLSRIPLKWQAGVGYFVRKMGGMDPTLISGDHAWNYSAMVRVGYTFYANDWMVLGERNDLVLLADTTGKAHYVGKFGIDADFNRGRHVFGLFLNYNCEFPRKLPFGSKDRLMEWGLRFRY